METKIQDQFISFVDSVMAYLPNLVGGIVLILLGWLCGWLVKKFLVQLSVILRIDRWLKRSRFEADFSKADVRYSLYHVIGNIGFIIVFLIFLDNALLAWKMHMISNVLSKVLLFLPRIIIALVIFFSGWLLSSWLQISMLRILHREEVPRASFISRFFKIIVMIFFSAISLVELGVAREIIIIGFATVFVTLGAIAVVLTIYTGRDLLKKMGTKNGEEEGK
jgi:hypothetical protein